MAFEVVVGDVIMPLGDGGVKWSIDSFTRPKVGFSSTEPVEMVFAGSAAAKASTRQFIFTACCLWHFSTTANECQSGI